MVFNHTHTKVTAKVFDKLNPIILLLLPEFYVPILTGCHNEISSVKENMLLESQENQGYMLDM